MFQEYFLKDSAILTTPSAPFRNGFFFFVAQPPLLFKEGNPLFESSNYGTSITGACQNATFCPVGSRTVTWQLYSPAGSFPSARLNFRGTALDLGSSPSTTASGGVSNALVWPW